jgi:hypothetical protein
MTTRGGGVSNYKLEIHIGVVSHAYRVAAVALTVACIGCVVAHYLANSDLFGDLAWVTGVFAVLWGLRIDVTANSPTRDEEMDPPYADHPDYQQKWKP